MNTTPVQLPDNFQKLPRGIRNNNPGNIRFNQTVNWAGQIGKDSDGFAVFSHMFYGIRALTIDLLNKYHEDGLLTVHDIITKYAPPEENDTQAYINRVCNYMSVAPDDLLNMHAKLHAFVNAITRQESGYPMSLLDISAHATDAGETYHAIHFHK